MTLCYMVRGEAERRFATQHVPRHRFLVSTSTGNRIFEGGRSPNTSLEVVVRTV